MLSIVLAILIFGWELYEFCDIQGLHSFSMLFFGLGWMVYRFCDFGKFQSFAIVHGFMESSRST